MRILVVSSGLWSQSWAGFTVDRCADKALAHPVKNEEDRVAVTLVTLHPGIQFRRRRRTPEEVEGRQRRAPEVRLIGSR